MDLYESIYALVEYGVNKGLIYPIDRTYMINRYLELYKEDGFKISDEKKAAISNEKLELSAILSELTDIALEREILTDNGITQRDLFDTKLMGLMTGSPHEIISTFLEKVSLVSGTGDRVVL